MDMVWKKLGLLFTPNESFEWAKSHAQVPTPMIYNNTTIRLFYSSRDDMNISRISYLDIEADNPKSLKYVHDTPILAPGKPGTFDDCGVMPSWVLRRDGLIFLYYIGWNVRNSVAYYNSVGLAISSDNGESFKKFSDGPLWDRDFLEPYFSASTCVIFDKGIWKNWYLSCTEYRVIDGIAEPRYHIKYAESEDGIRWKRSGQIAIDYKSENEAGIVKASVIVDRDIYRMWYSYRNFHNYRTDPKNSYKIGYAESYDGLEWRRIDNVSFENHSTEPWDSEMQCYPHVIDVGGNRFMFYNGNGFGKSGIGLCMEKYPTK